ncbi:MAG TPA: NADPH:quinone oxidoreductase family protein [Ramlibacter sp.]|uniref:NADPH:quinone oxidoreductase family protein n=1 Tax=Ramlibacter sp. TaxID=1917967 RepID=UPI002B585D19|nr:NADPH:quinone oxidoreductase family protein [Ramlibacter sp.]HVZ45779.1 NADPH:quinone oxidoreductase family protein [Ramlibacter sp.]
MKALVCKAFGTPDSLAMTELPVPEPAAGEVLIEGHFASLNFPDILMVAGTYQGCPPLPFVPGMETAGYVRAVGSGVSEFALGDRVMARTGGFGSFAEYACAPVSDVYHAPQALPLEMAAGFSVSYGSVYHALVDRARLQPGENLLVLGAGGGTGVNAVEVGKLLGARVIAAAGSADKLAAAREFGADEVFNYREEPHFRDTVKNLTGGHGADVVFDPVGGDAFDESLRCIAWAGRILVFGFASGRIPQVPANHVLVKGCDIVGVFTGAFTRKTPGKSRRNMEQLLAWVEAGRLKPPVPVIYGLDQVPLAMRHLQERTLVGKAAIRLR